MSALYDKPKHKAGNVGLLIAFLTHWVEIVKEHLITA